MTKTKLFIASSSDDFKTDLIEIGLFIARMNNCYVDRDLFFSPVMSNECAETESRNREIADSSAATSWRRYATSNPSLNTPR